MAAALQSHLPHQHPEDRHVSVELRCHMRYRTSADHADPDQVRMWQLWS
jgi:hypothetical protein